MTTVVVKPWFYQSSLHIIRASTSIGDVHLKRLCAGIRHFAPQDMETWWETVSASRCSYGFVWEIGHLPHCKDQLTASAIQCASSGTRMTHDMTFSVQGSMFAIWSCVACLECASSRQDMAAFHIEDYWWTFAAGGANRETYQHILLLLLDGIKRDVYIYKYIYICKYIYI